MMKDILNTWKISFFSTLFIIIISLLNVSFNYLAIEYISFWGTVIALFLILFNLVFLLVKRKWRYVLVSFILLLVSITFLVIYSFTMFWVYQSRPDKFGDNLVMFGDNLVIPQNIDLNIPLNMMREVDRVEILKEANDFEIYGGLGTYEYDFWIGKIDSGTIYLKAFEITQEYRLSDERLIESSSILVHNPTDSVIRFSTSRHFTIYEGDWGKPYAARFELWYKPHNGILEKKLLEKTYKIEGWQR